jgi:hypothetical protein
MIPVHLTADPGIPATAMIHVLVTSDAVIRDLLVDGYRFHAHATDIAVFQAKGTILVYREKLEPKIISEIIDRYYADKIWIIGTSRIVSTDHQLGDIVMPNVFLAYDHAIDTVEFDGSNRDDYLHDPLFLKHYEEQADLNFETFGLSIGGICVTKGDGMDGIDREQIEFAYSADCLDGVCYFLIEEAKRLGRDEDVYPVLAIVGQDSSPEDTARAIKNIPPVLIYLQSKISGEDSDIIALEHADDDFEEDDGNDGFDEDAEMEGFHQVRE